MGSMDTIVVATDGSRAAGAALDAALRLAGGKGDRVVAIAVWRALQHDFGLAYAPGAVLDDLLEQERVYAEGVLEGARQRGRTGGVDVETRLAVGDPAERICALADELDASLIAMGTHGYAPVVALLMGSVSAAVIRRTQRPVLVVREPERERSDPATAAGEGRDGAVTSAASAAPPVLDAAEPERHAGR